MNDEIFESQADAEGTDRSALIMMLTYVEAECRRLGNADAARYTALAASLIDGRQHSTPPAPEGMRRCCLTVAAPLN
jgi:hypothetical protein